MDTLLITTKTATEAAARHKALAAVPELICEVYAGGGIWRTETGQTLNMIHGQSLRILAIASGAVLVNRAAEGPTWIRAIDEDCEFTLKVWVLIGAGRPHDPIEANRKDAAKAHAFRSMAGKALARKLKEPTITKVKGGFVVSHNIDPLTGQPWEEGERPKR